MAPSQPSRLPLWVQMITGGIAGSVAEIFTIPLDTAKVRLQIQGTNLKPGDTIKYKGLIGTALTIAREEGPASLYKGLSAGLQRQMVFASIRIGAYDSVKQLFVAKDFTGEIPLFKKILAALTTGAVGIMVANPTDVVKVRLQAEGKLPPGVPRRYNGALDAYSKIIKSEGIKGLWTGIGPNVLRNATINASELATYDECKSFLVKRKGWMNDNIYCHFVCSAIAGFAAAVVGSPVDVIKTRIMGAKPGQFTGVLDCIVKTAKEGPLAFYDGFSANASRIISWNIVMFVTLDQFRQYITRKYY
jgi:solute carrier family 25 uncoupling protein 8/9